MKENLRDREEGRKTFSEKLRRRLCACWRHRKETWRSVAAIAFFLFNLAELELALATA